MKIEHLAIWVGDLEAMKTWYCEILGMKAGERYHNPKKGFSSYFLSFESGARIELMHRSDVNPRGNSPQIGYAHIALSLGSKVEVDEKTAEFKQKGIPVLDGPRTTGDGYYESVIQDPEGNLIELTI
ncbi:VOC family protein [Algoriphagus zhangzhouensis]|uniref:Lactoylglutathione lyase n=1 Tax=Algoriphagus zhangzhouensis TaxID=1073327 RepID=A0A1M7Z9Y7_9BACT|nr:VOC family protein [Algoriphagus zhangzhouensis]TDY47291.1 lactoylglutathione lyase [Algoriphagus zhangzhouensis]SHO61704.1 lactoylglutathione lyase [Algoriphagus zhangzhouensis]